MCIRDRILFVWGQTYVKTEDAKYGIAVDTMGMVLGLKDGDIVLACDTVKLNKLETGPVIKAIVLNNAKQLTVKRDGQEINLPIPTDFAQILTKYENKGKACLLYTSRCV